MKKLATILALTATVISAPAYAATPANAIHHAPALHQQSSDTVTWRGTVRGQDPDPYVRFQILRDAEAAHV